MSPHFDLQKTAELAGLILSDEEKICYAPQLKNILALAEQVAALDTEGVAPTAHAFDLKQRLRPDVVTESDQRTLFQGIAPEVRANLYIVPPVIE